MCMIILPGGLVPERDPPQLDSRNVKGVEANVKECQGRCKDVPGVSRRFWELWSTVKE